jgi:hypothetical protein
MAEDTVDTTTPEVKIRQEIETELRRQGVQRTAREVDGLVKVERKRRKEEEVVKMERSLKPLEYLRWISFGVRMQGTRLAFRWMIEIR